MHRPWSLYMQLRMLCERKYDMGRLQFNLKCHCHLFR